MSLSLVAAWRAIHLSLAFALLLQSLELLRLCRAWGDRGIWRWSALAREYGTLSRGLLGPLLCERGFLAVLVARALGSVLLGGFAWYGPQVPLLLVGFLLLSSLLIPLRFRGPFNGGSDAMTVMMLVGAGIPALAPGVKWVARAGLAWIAGQGIASYVLSGMAKLRESGWRSGRSLSAVLRSPHYGVPKGVARRLGGAGASFALSWCVLAFELGFPFAFAGPRACLTLVGAGLAFHAANARLLGQARFLWIWPVSYPAIIYWVP